MHYGHTPITYHHNANIFIALKAEFYAYGVNVIGTFYYFIKTPVYTEIIRGILVLVFLENP